MLATEIFKSQGKSDLFTNSHAHDTKKKSFLFRMNLWTALFTPLSSSSEVNHSAKDLTAIAACKGSNCGLSCKARCK